MLLDLPLGVMPDWPAAGLHPIPEKRCDPLGYRADVTPRALHCACGDRRPADARPAAARAGIVDPAGQRGSSGAIRIAKATGAAGILSPARASRAGPY